MGRAPIPGIRKARAVENVTNCRVVGFEGLAAPDHRAHLELAVVYVCVIGTIVFSPVEESPFASVVGERPKDLPGDTDVDMRFQADGNGSIQVLLGTEGPCTHAQGTSRTEMDVVPFVVSGKPKVRLETVFLMIGENT